MNSALQGGGRAASWGDAAPDWVRLFIGEMGEAQGRPTRLPAWRNHLRWRRRRKPENAFGRDSDQAWIGDESQSETCEDLPVREREPGCEPEELKVAQRRGAGKPQRKNKQQKLLELRGKRPQAQVAAAFLFSAPRREGPLHGTTDVCRWGGPGRPAYPSPAVLPPLGYYTL